MANTVKRIMLPPALGTYAFIWKPQNPPDGATGEPKYRVTLLFPKKNKEVLKDFMAAVVETATGKFGPEAVKLLKAKRLKNPVRDGDEERPEDKLFAGMYFITASSAKQPGVVDENVEVVIDQNEAYSGCTFRASVSLFAYDKAGNKGVGVGLNNIQVVKKGDRLDGRKSAESDFADYKTGKTATPDDGATNDEDLV